jgi:hypothetical protein
MGMTTRLFAVTVKAGKEWFFKKVFPSGFLQKPPLQLWAQKVVLGFYLKSTTTQQRTMDSPATTATFPEGTTTDRDDDKEEEYRDNNDDDTDDVVEVEAPPAKRARTCVGGRPPDTCWSLFTDAATPVTLSQARCKYCNNLVKYHCKSEKVTSHLNHCGAFRSAMSEVPSMSLASWYDSQGRPKGPSPGLLPLMQHQGRESGRNVIYEIPRQKSKNLVLVDIRAFTLPKIKNKEQEEFNQLIAMHYYMTGTSFKRIEEPHLIQALRKLRPDINIPTRKALSGKYLDMLSPSKR